MDQKNQYSATPQQPMMYQQPPAPSMAYQSNASNQALEEKNNVYSQRGQWAFGFWDCLSPTDTWYEASLIPFAKKLCIDQLI